MSQFVCDSRGVHEIRNTTFRNPDPWFVESLVGPQSESGIQITPGRILSHAPIWQGINIIAGDCAMLPKMLKRKLKTGGSENNETHNAFRLVAQRANPLTLSMVFWETLLMRAIVYGNGISEIKRDFSGRPVPADEGGLTPLLPEKTTPWYDDRGMLWIETRMQINGKEEKRLIDPLDTLHIKGLAADGIWGLSLRQVAQDSIGYGLALRKHGNTVFKNRARPDFLMRHPGTLSEQGRKHLRESYNDWHQGLDNVARWAILEEGMDITTLSQSNEDAQWIEAQKFDVDNVSRLLNIPPHMLGSMDRATFCLPAGQMILTEFGPKPIEMILAHQRVWSRADDGTMALKPVVRAEKTGCDEILQIRTTNRLIRCNARHPILCRRKYHAPRGGPGGYQCNEWRTEYVRAGELKSGDTIITLKSIPVGTNRPTISVSPRIAKRVEFMEFCGLLLGDGNINTDNGYVTIARAENALYMDHYREVIRREFTRKVRARITSNDWEAEWGDADESPVVLQESERQTRFSSISAARQLCQLGLSGNARTKRVPAWVFHQSEDRILAFLRGFLDADGSVDKKGRVSFSSCNETMLSQIRHLCMMVGVPVTNMRCQEGVTTLPDGKKKAFRQFCFTCSDPGENRRISSHDPRYMERMNCGKPFNRKGRAYPWFAGRGFDEEHCDLARICSIEKQPAEDVYDLCVKGSHSFIAEGVIVHNSNIEEQGRNYINRTLNRWLSKITWECWWKLLTRLERERLFFSVNVDMLLKGTLKDRAAAYNQLIASTILNPNEVREEEGWNPREGGDVYGNPNTTSNTPPAESAGESADESADERLRRIEERNAKLLADRLQAVVHNEDSEVIRAASREKNFVSWLDDFYQTKWPRRLAELVEGDVASTYCMTRHGHWLAVSGSVNSSEGLIDAVTNGRADARDRGAMILNLELDPGRRRLAAA